MPRIKDLKGEKFGKLTVIKIDEDRMNKNILENKKKRTFFLCKCDCGNDNLISIDSYKLTSGHTRSCGCYKKDRAKDRINDLTGKIFGNLKALKLDEERNKTSKDTYWLCECQCEEKNITSVATSALTCGRIKSCGCGKSLATKNRFKDILHIGDKFGRLTVVKHDGEKSKCIGKNYKSNYWICECECGNTTSVQTTHLTQGKTKSCGCLNSKNELQLQEIFNKYNIKYTSQVKYDGLVGVGNGQISYDFYLSDYNVLLEYQGEFHDGNIRYYDCDKERLKERLVTQQEHDKRKREYAKQNNVELLEIWYYEHKNDKELEILLLNKLKEIEGEL